jgi:hypothetical protein
MLSCRRRYRRSRVCSPLISLFLGSFSVIRKASPCRHRAPPRTGARTRRAISACTTRKCAKGPPFLGCPDHLVPPCRVSLGVSPCLSSLRMPPRPNRPVSQRRCTPVHSWIRVSPHTHVHTRPSACTPPNRVVGCLNRAASRARV